MNKKNLTAGVAFAAIALTTLTFASVSGGVGSKADFEAFKTAVDSGMYANLPDVAKAKISESQFADILAKNASRKAEKSAIDAEDYVGFRNAKIAQIPDETKFNTMVAHQKAQKIAQEAIEAAIKTNDFTAFKKAHTDLQASLAILKTHALGFEAKNPTDAHIQKHFDKLVTQYKTDGTLPKGSGRTGMMRMGMKLGIGHGMGEGITGRGESHMGKGDQRNNK